jgi:leucyl-tRNA---protein transferase
MQPAEIVVYDSEHECGYLPSRTARLPLRHPVARLSAEAFDDRLAAGDRRSGRFLYRAECPHCRACEPIRLDVERFCPDRTQRRMLRRGDQLLETRLAAPVVDQERVDLYNAHLFGRGLDRSSEPMTAGDYREFLVQSCCETLELSYWHDRRLVGVAIADAGKTSLSAVYCYYDPAFAKLSLGTYSILRQVEWCRQTGRRYLYLGFYIAQSPHMRYKARFLPHQRLVDGVWRDFPRG